MSLRKVSSLRCSRNPESYQLQHEDRQIEQLSNSFLETFRIGLLSPKTIAAYGYDLVYFFRWLALHKRHLFKFSRQDFFEYVKYQVDSGAKPRSVNRRLLVCELLLRFLKERGIALHLSHSRQREDFEQLPIRGPWPRKRGISRIRVKIPHTMMEPLDTHEVNRLLAHAKYYRDISIILLMVLVGLRRSEVVAIQFQDIDFASNAILIKGKGRKERSMPLPKMVETALRKYIEFERPNHSHSKKLFVIRQGKGRGKSITIDGVRSYFRRIRVSSKVQRGNPHRLRHTFAYSMVKAGVSIAVLQRMMGHSRYATTLNYVSLKAEDIAEQYLKAMETIEKRHATKTTSS